MRHKPKSPNRNVRLAEQMQKDIAQLVQREIDVATYGLITISHVDLSNDFSHAKVYFTVIGGTPENAGHILNEKAGYFHSVLFKLMPIHTVPTLHFIHDGGLERGLHVQRLIDQAAAELPPLEEDSAQAQSEPQEQGPR